MTSANENYARLRLTVVRALTNNRGAIQGKAFR